MKWENVCEIMWKERSDYMLDIIIFEEELKKCFLIILVIKCFYLKK